MSSSSSSWRWIGTWFGVFPFLLLGLNVVFVSTTILQQLEIGAAVSSNSMDHRTTPLVVREKQSLNHGHRRLLSMRAARYRKRERESLAKPKKTRAKTVARTRKVAVVNHNNINNQQQRHKHSKNNTAFLKSLDEEHLPMFQLSDFSVLGPSIFPKPSAIAEKIPLNESISTASPIVPYLTPTMGIHRATADAVLLFAAEYPLSSYILFISSLRQTGYDGDIVIAISTLDWKEKAVRSYLSHDPHVIVYAIEFSCFNAEWQPVSSIKGGMRVCQCHNLYGRQLLDGEKVIIPLPDPREPRTIPTTRYELYWIWVQAYNPNVWMLLIDARDTWFQTNPFDNLPRQGVGKKPNAATSGQLYFFGENIEATRIGKSEQNRKWLEHAYDNTVMQALADKPTICSGSSMGEQAAIETYLRAMVAESDETGTKLMGSDQGFHNYLYYSGKLRMANTVSNIMVFDQGRGRINNLGAMRIKPLEEWGNGNIVREQPDGSMQVFNWDGTLSPVVHQFDRHKELSTYVYDTLTSRYQTLWNEQRQQGLETS